MSHTPQNNINFTEVLASSVHDIKNSLATVRELIMQLSAKHQFNENKDFIQLEFETNRMNNSLVQLLELYKIDSAKFSLDIDEHSVFDIFQEVKAQQTPLLQLNKIKLTIECPENCYCYCDYNHICNALGSILNNAQRYTDTQISLSCYEEHGFIVFCIEDDGTGYPDQLLSIDLNNIPSNWISGSTGLGLHFVSTIASLHTARNTTGYIEIDNNSALGGARFRLFLP
jgi:signal transduction histidine kinase